MNASTEVTRPILLTGAHRSGTTWAGKMIAGSPQVAYISEPLNVLHRPGVMRQPVNYWYTYICEANEAEFISPFEETLGFQYHFLAEIRSLRTTKDLLRMGRDWSSFMVARMRKQRPLLKDPFAVFSIPWFITRFNAHLVVLVRHPAAMASSLKRLGWHFDFSDLTSQPLLMQHYLEPFRSDLSQIQGHPEDIIAQSSLLWKMIYHTVQEYQREFPEIILVRHEDLSKSPVQEFANLYKQLSIEFTPQTEDFIIRSSSEGNPPELSIQDVHSVHLDSAANIKNWVKRLTEQEIDRVRELTTGAWEAFYSSEEW